uniref:CSON002912 protein n=1 Tax=Culicoides sonorensis TaxID=179676 RepID=A0A336L3W6_CULSO
MNLPFIFLILGVSQPEYDQWHSFKSVYKKNYNTISEEKYRMEIFIKNLREIQNQNHDEKKSINEFSDLDPYELMEYFEVNNDENIETDSIKDEDINLEPELKWQEFKKNGINFETDYPYKARQGQCKIRSNNAPKLVRQVKYTANKEVSMHKQLSYSPLIIGIYASAKIFRSYKSGFITASDCGHHTINHAVLAVGAVKENGKMLWKCRNSWGQSWGDNGHFKMSMYENTCNIEQSSAFYVTVK